MGPRLDEDEMNRLRLRLLRTKKLKEAIRFFELNVAAFPKSANTWDSLAEAYMIGGKELAISQVKWQLDWSVLMLKSRSVAMLFTAATLVSPARQG